ncbi:uncharacterized protein [Musca autumnalis]|uniref:uncharacterized protein n=1 Tax=Musca autumnalis TaxID=221902 RepID=UPI003CF62A89
MLSIQQLIKALRKLQNNTAINNAGDLVKSIKHVAAASSTEGMPTLARAPSSVLMTSLLNNQREPQADELETKGETSSLPKQQEEQTNGSSNVHSSSDCCSNHNDNTNNINATSTSMSSSSCKSHQQQQQTLNCHNECFSLYSSLNTDGSKNSGEIQNFTTQDPNLTQTAVISTSSSSSPHQHTITTKQRGPPPHHINHLNQQIQQRSQRIQNFFQQQIFHHQQFHTQQHNHTLNTKHKQTQFAMSSLAAEPLATAPLQKDDLTCNGSGGGHQTPSDDESSSPSTSDANKQQNSKSGKPCFNAGLGDILQFMELIGNLKHTKRTGWVLRGVNDCESISGHMYRMSILTFLLDGTEGLNQIRCMELALVHDLAESLVGDITPFCGISKEEKKAMELKAMADICKLIEPRGKRMMELFEEYEHGESPESKFVKDLDRLDMVMQAFEYEKRDNCLLKHQEFFDSTEGKFNHPFVKKLVNEIYDQREMLAKAKGAVPPPKIEVPNMDNPATHAQPKPQTNGHHQQHELIGNNVETSKSS